MIQSTQKFVLLKADQDAYDDITAILGNGSYEVPDSTHGVKHISIVDDNVLGCKVFEFAIHRDLDDDRGINKDRQRNEIKVYGKSPDWMKGNQGDEFCYQWKFRIDQNFQYNTRFNHLHQIKSNENGTKPFVTLTAKKLFTLEINSDRKAQVSIEELKGQWVHVIENIRYGQQGFLQIQIKRLQDNKILIEWQGNVDGLFGGQFMRPKWGIYRSLMGDNEMIKDELVRFTDFYIAQGFLKLE